MTELGKPSNFCEMLTCDRYATHKTHEGYYYCYEHYLTKNLKEKSKEKIDTVANPRKLGLNLKLDPPKNCNDDGLFANLLKSWAKGRKGRFGLISGEFTRRIALRLEEGEEKHGKNDWRLNPTYWSHYLDKIHRHLAQWEMGMTNEDHLGAAATDLMILMTCEERRIGINDMINRPEYNNAIAGTGVRKDFTALMDQAMEAKGEDASERKGN